MKRRLQRLAPVLAGAMLLGACGAATQAPRARDGYQSYLRALRGDNPKPVYNMLTPQQRKQTPYAKWSQDWKDSALERELQADELEKSLKTHGVLEERAAVRFQDGKRITLRRSAVGWRLDQALVGRSRAADPQDAIRIFAGALHDRDVALLLRILSSRRRGEIESKLGAFEASLERELDHDKLQVYRINESRAEMTWSHEGLRYKIVLVREEGDWHLDDVHLGPDPVPEDDEAKASAEDKGPVLTLPRR